MSFLESVKHGKQHRPRRTAVYGTHGIGKTTWAAKWPGAVILPTEDGCGDLDVASFPLAKTLGEAWGPIIEVGNPEADHDFKTIVLDSADWLEQLIWADVCQKANKKAITDFDFGKGYGSAARIFQNILSAFNACRDAGLHVVIIAHCEVKKFNEPGIESYDRYTPKLHKEVAALLQEWADEVLFCNYKTYVKREDMGFNKSRGIAVGNSERVIYTQEGPGHLAKNRLGLPVEMSMDFDEYAPFLGK
jgi:hypothetical protein